MPVVKNQMFDRSTEIYGRLLKERYETGGGQITVKIIAGEGHKVSPSFFECQELLDFVLVRSLSPR